VSATIGSQPGLPEIPLAWLMFDSSNALSTHVPRSLLLPSAATSLAEEALANKARIPGRGTALGVA
jgi:hypothetical protein